MYSPPRDANGRFDSGGSWGVGSDSNSPDLGGENGVDGAEYIRLPRPAALRALPDGDGRLGETLGESFPSVRAMSTYVALLAFVSGLLGGVGLTMLYLAFTREDED